MIRSTSYLCKRKNVFLVLFLLIWLNAYLQARDSNPFYSGSAKAQAMGGAYVGLADDFSAFILNPAGATQFSSFLVGIGGNLAYSRENFRLDAHVIGIGNETKIDTASDSFHPEGMFAVYQSFGDLVVGVGLHSFGMFGSRWKGEDLALVSHGREGINWESRYSVLSLTPTAAYKINDRLALGFSLHINRSQLNISSYAGWLMVPIDEIPYFREVDLGQFETKLTGYGIGATLGILFKPFNRFRLGLVLRWFSQANLSGSSNIDEMSTLADAVGENSSSQSKTTSPFTLPLSIEVGTAWLPSDHVTLTADVRWTHYSEMEAISLDYQGEFWQLFMSYKKKDRIELRWRSSLRWNVGIEYRLGGLSLRGGAFVETAPGPDYAMNFLFSDYSTRGISAGIGFNGKGWTMGLGLQYLDAGQKNLSENSYLHWPIDFEPGWESLWTGIYDKSTLTPYISISF